MTARAPTTEQRAARPDHCHWTRTEDGDEVLIPRCMGGAVKGMVGCTCALPQSELDRLREGRDKAAGTIITLRARLREERHHRAALEDCIRDMRLAAREERP